MKLLPNHTWVKDPFKVSNKASDSTLRPTLKKVLPVKYWCKIKERCPQLPEKAIEILFPFLIAYLYEAKLSSYA